MAVATLAVRPARWLREMFERLRDILPRRRNVDSAEARDYQSAVTPLLERAECLYQQWLEQVETEADTERIANLASTQSWEMAALAERLGACTPPRPLQRLHGRCEKSFKLARRAGQRLSTGYRYHNAVALCDGHATMDDARRLYLSALAELAELTSRR